MAHNLVVLRKILITLGLLVSIVVVLLAIWIFFGRQVSLFVDRFATVEIAAMPIESIVYEGNGTGGILIVNKLSLSLNEVSPGISLSVGSTKDNQLALASSEKVFALGPLTLTADNTGDRLATVPPPGDQAFIVKRHSALSWPTPFDFNFMTGQSPSWKRHTYYEIRWRKSSGANFQLLWRYEQFFYPGNGWGRGFMTREGSTGLIRVEIRE